VSNILAWNELQIFTFFFVFIRVSSLMIFVPLFGDKAIPINVKILLAVAVSWVCFPILWASGMRINPDFYQSTFSISSIMAQEIFLGVCIGFISRWVFDAAMFSGQLAGNAMGLSMASVLDPQTESQTIPLSEIKYILTLMLFLAGDGHLLLLKIINDSFQILPIGAASFFARHKEVVSFLIEMSAEILLLSVKLAAPVIVIILMVNITFGLISRAVPQMNVFAVSFGANILIGLFVVIISFPTFTNLISSAFDGYAAHIIKFMELLHG